MERLLHYVWQHKLYDSSNLLTIDGRKLEVIDAGLRNENAGPDFFNAKIKLDGQVWIGNIEIHSLSSDWARHGHYNDEKYNNVVLHVVEKADMEVATQDGKILPQCCIQVPEYVEEHYYELLRTEKYPPCYRIIPQLPAMVINQWLDTLSLERLEQKTERINNYANLSEFDWEKAFFITLARGFGFGINGDAFEEWAFKLPLSACGKHRDSLFQIEAMFLGMAGLLDEHFIPKYHLEFALQEGYFTKLQNEFKFLAHKFSLQPMNGHQWNFLRLRPQNFPHIRLVQLANLYYSQKINLSMVLDVESLADVKKLLEIGVTPYWQTHYGFGGESGKSPKVLQQKSIDLLTINAIVPVLFAYGRHRLKEVYCSKAIQLLGELKAEENRYTRVWEEVGLPVKTASDSQALIQLRTLYCDRKDCLRCRFGYYFMKNQSLSAQS